MRSPRIFQANTLETGATITLDAAASHYIHHVLRLGLGAPLRLFDGEGHEYGAHISQLSKRSVTVELGAVLTNNTESKLQIHLGQGLAKGEKMDFIVQKAVELGVTSITPLLAERSEVRLSAERFAKRVQHWQAVAVSACEQSGRSYVPAINTPQTLSAWLSAMQSTPCLALHPGAEQPFSIANQQLTSASLAIGPEGGWSDNELHVFAEQQVPVFSLGSRVLRTETAAIAALTVLQYALGDLSAPVFKD